MPDQTPLDLLAEELAFFEENKSEWLTHYSGKFALIKGRELIDTFTTLEEGYQEGVRCFGTNPFLVRQIIEEEPIEEIPALVLGLLNARL